MTVKLSKQKVSKIFQLYFQGFTQTAIAGKLGINQATVSLYLAEFNAMADEEGLEATAEEYGVMDIVKELHSLGAELKKSSLTTEDAKRGLQVAVTLENCDVPQSSYKDVIKTCIKMNNEGFLSAAMTIHKVEENTGKSYKTIEKQAANLPIQIEQGTKELSAIKEKIGSEKQSLAEIQQQKKSVEKDFKQVLDQVDLNLGRLKKVESLVLALKKAGVTDGELEGYIERQSLLNKSGILLDIFIQILDAMKVHAAVDGGKSLLKKLTEFNSLDETISGLKHEKQSLINQTKDLGEKAKLRGTIQVELTHLQTQKKELEGSVAKLNYQEETTNKSLEQIKTNHMIFTDQLTILNTTVSEKQKLNQSLDKAIEQKQNNVADLKELEKKREVVLRELAEAETRKKLEGRRWEAFKGFLGLVKASSMADVRKAAQTLPKIVEETQEGQYSTEFLANYILRELSGPVLAVYRCESCGARFTVDKPPVGSYRCPVNGPGHTVVIDKDATTILAKAMEEPKIRSGYTVTPINPPTK